MGVGEILDGAVTVIRQNWKVMIGLAVVVSALSGFAQFVLKVSVLRDATLDRAGIVASLATSLIGWFATIFLTGMLTVIVSQAVLGQRTTLEAAWARVRPQFWKLLGLSILVPLCWIFGLIGVIIGAIYLYVALSVSTPALILESARVTQAMGRSFALVQNLWWRTFGILLLTALIAGVIGVVIGIPFLIIAGGSIFAAGVQGDNYTFVQLVTTIGGIIAGAVTYPFTASVVTLLYVDMRMRKEGLDIELMRATGSTPPGQYGGGQFGGQYGSGQYGGGQYGQPPG
jgi:hypothetical protein